MVVMVPHIGCFFFSQQQRSVLPIAVCLTLYILAFTPFPALAVECPAGAVCPVVTVLLMLPSQLVMANPYLFQSLFLLVLVFPRDLDSDPS